MESYKPQRREHYCSSRLPERWHWQDFNLKECWANVIPGSVTSYIFNIFLHNTFHICVRRFFMPLTDGDCVFMLHSTLVKLEAPIKVWLRPTWMPWLIFAGRRPGVFFCTSSKRLYIFDVKLRESLYTRSLQRRPIFCSASMSQDMNLFTLGRGFLLVLEHLVPHLYSFSQMYQPVTSSSDLKIRKCAYCINPLSSTAFRQNKRKCTVCYIIFQELKKILVTVCLKQNNRKQIWYSSKQWQSKTKLSIMVHMQTWQTQITILIHTQKSELWYICKHGRPRSELTVWSWSKA